MSRIPETDEDQPTAKVSASAQADSQQPEPPGGMMMEMRALPVKRLRSTAESPLRPIIVGAAGLGAVLVYSGDLLKHRQSVIKRWTKTDKPATLGASIGIGSRCGHPLAAGIGNRVFAVASGYVRALGFVAHYGFVGHSSTTRSGPAAQSASTRRLSG